MISCLFHKITMIYDANNCGGGGGGGGGFGLNVGFLVMRGSLPNLQK